jgi:predicted Zn-dependent protease
MTYENPPVAEGINYSSEHPLKEFSQLLIAVAVLAIVAIMMINVAVGSLARQIPFEFEQKMAESAKLLELISQESLDNGSDNRLTANKVATRLATKDYLQSIADKISLAMELPSGMSLTLHYNDSDMVNAYATLGGHIVFYEGLLSKLKSEDELAAVMAHEIAHVRLRHPIVAIGKGLTIASLAASVSGASGSSAGRFLLSSSANLSLLKFSRDQEAAADAESAAALVRIYGHIGGAKALFQHFADIEEQGEEKPTLPEMFRSHPYSDMRWTSLKTLALQQSWSLEGQTLPLQLPQIAPTESELLN